MLVQVVIDTVVTVVPIIYLPETHIVPIKLRHDWSLAILQMARESVVDLRFVQKHLVIGIRSREFDGNGATRGRHRGTREGREDDLRMIAYAEEFGMSKVKLAHYWLSFVTATPWHLN